jgi:hypothetical protein
MATRLRPRHQEEVKTKIQTSMVLNRLHDFLGGKIDLSTAQVSAAKILLDKSLSNAPTKVEGQLDTNLTIELVEYARAKAKA